MKDFSSTFRLKKTLLLILITTIVVLILITAPGPLGNLPLRHINHDTNRQEDHGRLIDISFAFLHLPSRTCRDDQSEFIVAVHSAPGNTAKRATIRDTWGHSDNNVRVVFMLGIAAGDAESIAEESEAFDDIVQGSFSDSYHNLTYKHVMVLKYAVYHCPRVRYVVKLDDDVFTNTPNLKEFLHLYHLENADSRNILCSKMDGNPVLRSGRWGVAVEEYPGEFYPIHCSGFAIIYPRAAVLALYSQAQKTKYFWIDDAHVSGTLAEGANVSHTGIERLILSNEEVVGIVDFNFVNVTKPFLFGRMNLDEHQIRFLWNFVKHHTPKASILDFLD